MWHKDLILLIINHVTQIRYLKTMQKLPKLKYTLYGHYRFFSYLCLKIRYSYEEVVCYYFRNH